MLLVFLWGENGCVGMLGSTAPLLTRFAVCNPDFTLPFVDCDHRWRFPNPSPFGLSDRSTATLCTRLCSCDIESRPSRCATEFGSLGLCDLTGPAEVRTPVLDELRDPVRFTVTTDAEDKEFEREE